MAQPARFFKADLHMQTPMDAQHWLGAPVELTDAAAVAAAADAYVGRCAQVGLEIVAITEHNFGRSVEDSFIPHLQAAAARLEADTGHKLVIFPGFEVTGPIGRGAHLICVFEPETPLVDVDAKLTVLGLPPAARFTDGRNPVPVPTADMTFQKMLRIIQEDQETRGICFGAHPNDSGVLDSATVEQWWSQDVIKNESFLAIELPRPRSEWIDRPGTTLIKSILTNIDPRYERAFSIASICNSDAKALAQDPGITKNFIGFRHTWLKMSEPSIEGLRQAFLDHESRVRFGDRPEDSYGHARIRKLSVRGARFLADQEITFSPSMNTLIGGGGTGKSTIIEYIRLMVQQPAITGTEARANFEKLMGTINGGTEITLEFERDGGIWELRNTGRNGSEIVAGLPVPDLAKFFPVRCLSQREIYAIADDRTARRQLLDDLIGPALDALRRQGEDAVQEVKGLDSQIDELTMLRTRITELETERIDAQTRMDNLKRLEEPLARWRSFLRDKEVVDSLGLDAAQLADEVNGAVAKENRAELEEGLRPAVDALDRAARLAEKTLRETVESAVAAYRQSMETALADPELTAWRQEYELAASEYEEMRTELIAAGTDPDQYLQYEATVRDRLRAIEELTDRISGLGALEESRAATLARIRSVWTQETELRSQKAQSIQAAVPRTTTGVPFLTVAVHAYGDEEGFKSQMQPFVRDRRRLSDDDWTALLDAVVGATPVGSTPVDTLTNWIGQLAAEIRPQGFPWPQNDRRTGVLREWCDAEACRQFELIRVPDRVVVALYRDDGSLAGELEGGLSVGQKSTAILTMLLANDDAPAVIDQPEDEIDNEFTYRELVPLLRRVKEQRQLILSTHDPNLPVNGDAELIYALEARDGRGVTKEVDGAEAVGALDMSAVRVAVEEIMEGSEEAFRRRSERYGF